MARWADGWFPIDMAERDFAIKMKWLDNALETAGREPGSVPVTVMIWPGVEANFERYQELGVQEVVVGLPTDVVPTPDLTMRCIDSHADLIAKLGH